MQAAVRKLHDQPGLRGICKQHSTRSVCCVLCALCMRPPARRTVCIGHVDVGRHGLRRLGRRRVRRGEAELRVVELRRKHGILVALGGEGWRQPREQGGRSDIRGRERGAAPAWARARGRRVRELPGCCAASCDCCWRACSLQAAKFARAPRPAPRAPCPPTCCCRLRSRGSSPFTMGSKLMMQLTKPWEGVQAAAAAGDEDACCTQSPSRHSGFTPEGA